MLQGLSPVVSRLLTATFVLFRLIFTLCKDPYSRLERTTTSTLYLISIFVTRGCAPYASLLYTRCGLHILTETSINSPTTYIESVNYDLQLRLLYILDVISQVYSIREPQSPCLVF